MVSIEDQQGPRDKQPVGYSEQGRTDDASTGDTDQPPSTEPDETVSRADKSSEGEPGRSAADSTGGQPGAGDIEKQGQKPDK